MVIVLILFFISLLAIITMVGTRIIKLQKEPRHISEETYFDLPDPEKVKRQALETVKQYSFAMLVMSIRVYLRSSHFLKKRYKEAHQKTKELINKYSTNDKGEPKKEVSKFLKLISEYKGKVSRIKHKIKEEENLE